MKYSFLCKHCGESFMSNNKEEVKSFREHHRIDPNISNYATAKFPKYCPMVKTKMGTWVRPSILKGMNARMVIA